MLTSNMASAVTSYYCTLYQNSRHTCRHLWSLTTHTTALHVLWRYHIDPRSKGIISNLWSYSFLTCEVLPLNSSAQAVGERHHQRGGKGTLAFRVSPHIMDRWAAAKLIVKLQECVCMCDILHMQMRACLKPVRACAIWEAVLTRVTQNYQIIVAWQFPSGQLWILKKRK